MRAIPFLSALVLLGAYVGAVNATEATWASLKTQAYIQGNQVVVYSDDNNFAGESDDTLNTDFRDVLVGGSVSSSPEWLFSGQVISRKFGDLSDGSPEVDFAFLTLRPISGYDGSMGLRLGRVKSPYGWYNEARDNAFTRPSILLPQSIYSETDRGLLFSQDGGHLFAEKNLGDHAFSLDIGVFWPNLSADESNEVYWPELGSIQGDQSYSLAIADDWNAGEFRWKLSYNHIDYQFTSGEWQVFTDGSDRYESALLSLEYNAASWSLTSELEWFKNDTSRLMSDEIKELLDDDGISHGNSGYVQGVWRFAPQWDVITRFDVLFGDRAEKGNPQYTSRDYTLGLGYHLQQHWLVRAEWHHVRGGGWLTYDGNEDASSFHETWNMGLVQLSFLY